MLPNLRVSRDISASSYGGAETQRDSKNEQGEQGEQKGEKKREKKETGVDRSERLQESRWEETKAKEEGEPKDKNK